MKLLGLVALALTIVPPVLFMTRSLAEATMKSIMLAAVVLWFASAPFGMKGGAEWFSLPQFSADSAESSASFAFHFQRRERSGLRRSIRVLSSPNHENQPSLSRH